MIILRRMVYIYKHRIRKENRKERKEIISGCMVGVSEIHIGLSRCPKDIPPPPPPLRQSNHSFTSDITEQDRGKESNLLVQKLALHL